MEGNRTKDIVTNSLKAIAWKALVYSVLSTANTKNSIQKHLAAKQEKRRWEKKRLRLQRQIKSVWDALA